MEEVTFACDSLPEETGFELVWGFSCQAVVSGCCRFFVRSGKAVLRPVVCDQVRGARGRGQGTETVAKLGGLPASVACVWRRLRRSPFAVQHGVGSSHNLVGGGSQDRSCRPPRSVRY